MEKVINVTLGARDKKSFIKTIEFCSEIGNKVVAYEVRNGQLIGYWHYNGEHNVKELPYEMDMTQWAEFAWGWLANQEVDLNRPGDGSWVKGFNVKAKKFMLSLESDNKDDLGILYSFEHINYAWIVIKPVGIYISK